MIVRCLSNRGSDLPETSRDPAGGFHDKTVFELQVDQHYVVYGLTIHLNHVWYYLCAGRGDTFPIWYPSPLFEVADGRLSAQWIFNYFLDPPRGVDYAVIAFSEWANDLSFYDRLTDGEEEAVLTFQRYKRLIDDEAKLPQQGP